MTKLNEAEQQLAGSVLGLLVANQAVVETLVEVLGERARMTHTMDRHFAEVLGRLEAMPLPAAMKQAMTTLARQNLEGMKRLIPAGS